MAHLKIIFNFKSDTVLCYITYNFLFFCPYQTVFENKLLATRSRRFK